MADNKKVLIITYYWPPAGGPGVQRWLKFAKYLPEFGWEPIIYTPENPSYPLLDESLNEEVPKGIKTVKTSIWEPYQLAEKLSKSNKKFKGGQFDVGKNQSLKSKLSIWVRGNFFIPDARVFWVKPSIRFLKKYLQEHQIDTIVTTGPPHSMHLIGLGLKKEFPQIKWIADFRDPWTEISYYKHLKLTKNSDAKHRKLEKEVFENADLTLATSFTDAENFAAKGANAFCITNGYETSSNTDLSQKTIERTKNSFSLSYIGVLEQLRNPKILWEVIRELKLENTDFAADLKITFAGRLDEKIAAELHQLGLSDSVINLGYLSHQESIRVMNDASILLITNFPETASKGIIPGKLFEYLSTGNPILSFGPENADVARILEQTRAGAHFNYSQKTEVKNSILQHYQKWKSNLPKDERMGIEQYTRKNLTKKLAEKLSEIAYKN